MKISTEYCKEKRQFLRDLLDQEKKRFSNKTDLAKNSS